MSSKEFLKRRHLFPGEPDFYMHSRYSLYPTTTKWPSFAVARQRPDESEKRHAYWEYRFSNACIIRLNALTHKCSYNRYLDQLQNGSCVSSPDHSRYRVHIGRPTRHPSHSVLPGYLLPVSSTTHGPVRCAHRNNHPEYESWHCPKVGRSFLLNVPSDRMF